MGKKKQPHPNPSFVHKFTKEYGHNSTKEQYMDNLETLVNDLKKSVVVKDIKVYHADKYVVFGYDVEFGSYTVKSGNKDDRTEMERKSNFKITKYAHLKKLVKKAKKTGHPELKIRYHVGDNLTKDEDFQKLPVDTTADEFARIEGIDFYKPENSMRLFATMDANGSANVEFHYLKKDQLYFKKIDKCINNLVKKGYTKIE